MRKRPFSLWLCWGWWAWLWLVALVMVCAPTSTAYADDCLTNPFNLADCLRTPGYREAYVTAMVALGVEPVLISQILRQSGRKDLSDQDLNNWIRNQLAKWAKKRAAQTAGSAAASGTADFLNQLVKPPFPEKPDNRQGPAPPKVAPPDDVYDYTPGKIMSGEAAKRYLKSIGAWDKLTRLKKGDSWDDKIKVMEGDPGKTPVTDFSIPWKDDDTVDMDNIVFVMPGVPPGTPPPPPPDQVTEDSGGGEEEVKYGDEDKKDPIEVTDPVEEKKPPTPKENYERYRDEKREAVKKLIDLNAKADKLDAEWVKKEREWSLTRMKAASDAVVDLLDFLSDLASSGGKSSVKGAFIKDLVKNGVKEYLGLMERLMFYGGSFVEDAELGPLLKTVLDDVTNPGGYSLVGVLEHAINPSKLSENVYKYVKVLPGGALKQKLQNVLIYNRWDRLGNALGPVETAVSAGKDALDRYYEVDALHKEMGKISDEEVEIRKEIRQQEFNRDVAELGMERSRKDVEEWNRLFPHQAQRR